MTDQKRGTFRLTIALLCGFTACTSAPAEHDVAVTAQALGGFSALLNVGAESPMDIGESYSVFRNQPNDAACAAADVVRTQTGERLNVPALPGCANLTSGTSQFGVYVADQRGGKIHGLQFNVAPAAGTGGAPPTYTWITTAVTNAIVSRMKDSPQYLYWYGNQVLHRVRKAIQTEQGNVAVAGQLLYATDNYAVVETTENNGSRELRQYDFAGTATPTSKVLATATDSFAPWFSADDNYYYWTVVGPAGGTNAIRMVAKTGGTPTDAKATSTIKYTAPVSNGGALYWVTTDLAGAGGPNTMVRKNLSNGNHVSVNLPYSWLDTPSRNPLRLFPSGLYFAASASTTTNNWTLYRGQL